MVEKLENEKLDFGNLKMLISPISMIWVQDELGQDELGDGIFQIWSVEIFFDSSFSLILEP